VIELAAKASADLPLPLRAKGKRASWGELFRLDDADRDVLDVSQTFETALAEVESLGLASKLPSVARTVVFRQLRSNARLHLSAEAVARLARLGCGLRLDFGVRVGTTLVHDEPVGFDEAMSEFSLDWGSQHYSYELGEAWGPDVEQHALAPTDRPAQVMGHWLEQGVTPGGQLRVVTRGDAPEARLALSPQLVEGLAGAAAGLEWVLDDV
jgi:hypothetical protein